ncbi:RNA-directed DNA polymerase, eukaryota, reverse transcriptase zinc-binding domain protein [Tanacetum coccineum]
MYLNASKDEEKLLYQKSKIKWLSVGDQDNSFFHKVIKSNQQRNRVVSICDEADRRFDGKDVAEQFVKHFQGFLGQLELFGTNSHSIWFSFQNGELGDEMEAAYENKCLSYAGRLLLIASILEPIQVYWATVFLLPKTIIKDINKLLEGFLWCNGEISRGKTKVAWKNVYKPKDKGGLRLKVLDIWNEALLIKHIWNIASKKDSLWVKWVNVVKLKKRNFWEIQCESNDSWGWRNLLNLRNHIISNIVYQIGDGTNTSMWFDNWSSLGPIIIAGIGLRDGVDISNKLVVLVSLILVRLMKIKVIWRTNDGKITEFTVRQVYNDMSAQWNNVNWWKLIWFSYSIPKHSFIMWMAINDKLMTQDRLKKWGSYDIMVCALCKKGEFAKSIMKGVSVMIKVDTKNMKWESVINEFTSRPNGKSI